MMSTMHPAFLLFTVALLVGLSRGMVRQFVLLAGVGFTLWNVLLLDPASQWSFVLAPYTLQLLQVDALSQVFALIFSLITCLGALYALHRQQGGEHVATLVYAGAALGVVYAGDLLTLFVFWELMAVSSLFVIWYGGTPLARAAGFRYLLVHILGGSLLFCGLILHLGNNGALTLQALSTGTPPSAAAFWLILLGIAINAAIPPLHAWLTDAYPESSVTGGVFLSALTTKTAVYVLVRLFPGTDVLVWAGTIMTLYGVIYAILESDIRRLLSYHIVSQVGYMVTAAGLGTALALNGAVAHAFCHILYKALLFMGAGAVIQATGKRSLHDFGGLGRHLRLVFVLYMVAAFSISGVPFFNGFISKSMIISAAAEAHWPIVELLLTLASVGTFLSVGLKLPYFTFLGPQHHEEVRLQRLPPNMYLAMLIGAFLCIWLGLFPEWLYVHLPFAATYHPYSVDHLLSTVQLLLGTAIGFWWLLDYFGHETTVSLDVDWLYRKPLARGLTAMIAGARQVGSTLEAWRNAALSWLIPYFQNPFLVLIQWSGSPSHLAHDFPDPAQAPVRPGYEENRYRRPIGVTVLWIMVFFALMVLYAWGRQMV